MVANESEKEKLQILVKSCLLEINQLKTELIKLKKEKDLLMSDSKVTELENSIKEKEKEIISLSIQLENLENSIKEKDNLIETQQSKISELSNFKESFNDIRESLEKDLNNFKTQELSQQNEKLKSALDTIIEKDNEIKSLISEIEDYKEKIVSLEGNISNKDSLLELQKEIDSKENEIQLLKASAMDENVVSSLKSEISNRDKRIAELEELKSSFDGKLKEKDFRINELEEIKSSFKNIKDSLEKDIGQRKNKELKEINSNLQSALNEVVKKDKEIKSLVDNLDKKNNELQKIKDNNISKNEYEVLKKEIQLKDLKIKELEEIKGLFSDLDKGLASDLLTQDQINLITDSKKTISKETNLFDGFDKKSQDKLNTQLEKVKKELNVCRETNKELEFIKNCYLKITSSPKKDLTSFQSQIYYLIPDEPMNSQEIHNFIRENAFKDISYNNISNILKGLERKGYLSFSNGDNEKEGKWTKIDKV
ncbi:MAG: hypothetical protein FWE58_04915 [Methanobrevibacter sp.]|nr:hypothetical protein [Methanobrevibacter sp.]